MFPLMVQLAPNFPVDIYLLMDLSLSMDDDLTNLKRLGNELGKYEHMLILYYMLTEYMPYNTVYSCFHKQIFHLLFLL